MHVRVTSNMCASLSVNVCHLVALKLYSLSISLSDHYESSHFGAVTFHYPRIKDVSCLFGF